MSTLIGITPLGGAKANEARHPLEPLSAEEVRAVVALLKNEGKVTPTTRFVSVALKEPDKTLIHHPTRDGISPRGAEVVLFDNAVNACYEASLSITDGTYATCGRCPIGPRGPQVGSDHREP